MDFSYIVPVNRRLGFAITGGTSTTYSNLALAQAQWRGVGAATNGNAFPHTTPDRPYLSTYTVRDGATNTTRNAFGVTVDYKLTSRDRVSFAYQWSSFKSVLMNRLLTFNVNRVLPGNFTPTSTHGAAGAGSIQIANDAGVDRLNRTYMPTLTWYHDGPVWRLEGGVGLSYATNHIRGGDKGFFNLTQAQRTGVTVAFDDIRYLRPGTVRVTDGTTGAPVDPHSLSSYVMTSATAQRRNPIDLQQSIYANARRDFLWQVPVTLKSGFNVRQSVRDIRNHSSPHAFVGADGRGTTTPAGSDDSAVPFLDVSFSQRTPPYGFPRTQWVSPELVWEAYKVNPTHFVLNQTNEYNTDVNSSKRAEEVVSAAYLRGDVQLFGRRLKLVGGLRAEQTNIVALGPLTDPTRNFQRDASGAPILGANGRPLPVTTNAFEARKLTFLERGTRAEKEYFRLFPNLNASFNLRENLVARVAYYYSVGRPDFNQYAGGLTLPDTENLPSPGNRIVVNNVGIKAWTAKTTNVRLEYYFEGIGQISAGAFRRDFDNFFGGTVFSPSPEFLALYGLDPALYGAYDVSTQENINRVVRMQGINLSYKQALTFLPHWARGMNVFANGSTLRVSGPTSGSFNGDFNRVPRSGSWGFSLTRERFNARINWNYRGRQQQGLVAASTSVGAETYNWTASRYSYDILGEYNISKRLAAFATLRNVNDAPLRREIAGPNTPAHARLNQLVEYGSLWTFGLKGTF
jgi:TonB-dependent receptor